MVAIGATPIERGADFKTAVRNESAMTDDKIALAIDAYWTDAHNLIEGAGASAGRTYAGTSSNAGQARGADRQRWVGTSTWRCSDRGPDRFGCEHIVWMFTLSYMLRGREPTK
jgi:hypothetical protein